MIPRRIYKEIKDSLGFFPLLRLLVPGKLEKQLWRNRLFPKSGSRQFILI